MATGQGIFGAINEAVLNTFANTLGPQNAASKERARKHNPLTVAIGSNATPNGGGATVTGASVFAGAVKQVAAAGGKGKQSTQYTVQRFIRSIGGGHVDQAQVIAERGAGQLYLQNATIRPSEIGQQLSIFNGDQRVFWGVVEDASYSFGDDADSKLITASIQPWHFGPPVAAAQYLNITRDSKGKETRTVVMASEPIVFNGFVDPGRELKGKEGLGYFVGNCAHLGRYTAKKRDGKDTTYEANMLVPLEVLQTSSGQNRYVNEWRTYDDRNRWTLRNAARYLCALGNYETLIANPKDGDYDTLPDIVLPRTEMQLGSMLPQLLDDLLTPYGCSWYVEVGDDAGGGGGGLTTGASVIGAAIASIQNTIAAARGATKKPRIKFVRYGQGTEVEAKYAKVGALSEFGVTNVDLSYSTAPTINEVHCIGGPFTVEGTFELYRVSEDKWAMNEAGDYPTSDYDPWHTSADSGLPDNAVPVPDLTGIFPAGLLGKMASSPFVSRVQRRRRFMPTITVSDTITGDTQPKGPHNGFLIEIIDLAQEDVAEASKEWLPIDKITDPMFRHVRVLEDECALIFDRGLPEDGDEQDQPENFFLKALGPNARIRITASLVGDFAGQKVITRDGRNPSVTSTSRTFVWHDPKRWPCRRVITSTRYKSQYQDDDSTNKTPTVDEVIADMEQAAKQILERTDAAQIGGTLSWFGLHHAVTLGGVVKKIAGREISLTTKYDATGSSGDAIIYPQIVAVEYSPEQGEIRAVLSVEPGLGLEAVQ